MQLEAKQASNDKVEGKEVNPGRAGDENRRRTDWNEKVNRSETM